MTENKICKKCPLDLVDANTKKGCIKCEAATRATEGDPRSSSLNCIKCRVIIFNLQIYINIVIFIYLYRITNNVPIKENKEVMFL